MQHVECFKEIAYRHEINKMIHTGPYTFVKPQKCSKTKEAIREIELQSRIHEGFSSGLSTITSRMNSTFGSRFGSIRPSGRSGIGNVCVLDSMTLISKLCFRFTI